MRNTFALTIGIGLACATALAAETRVYPYHASANFCPEGLQPVTIDGTICCGKPNQSVTYQAMMAHPVGKSRHRAGRADCPVGHKGCS